MSRTYHSSKGAGYDFGARYNCDKGYSGGVGKFPKKLARRERRNNSKKMVLEETRLIEEEEDEQRKQST